MPVQHRFVLELLHGQRRIQEVCLEKADFARVVEAAFFDALRRGELASYQSPADLARIEPCFDGDGPTSDGFDVVLQVPSGREVRKRFGVDVFETFVRGMGALAETCDSLNLPYRFFGFDSAISEVVNYTKKVDAWMRAGGRDEIAASLGLRAAA